MYLISEKLITNFINIPRIEEQTLPDALQFIVANDDSFKAACYFSCNEFRNTINCYDFYPPEIENLKTSINEHIKKLDLDLNGEIRDGEGLIIYVAKKFINKEYDKCYISIKDVDLFKNNKTNELNRYYEEILTGYNSEYFLPVYIKDKYSDNSEKRILHAVLVLFSNKDNVTVNEYQLKSLSDILSVFITMKTTKDADKRLNQFINDLSIVINVDSIIEKNKKVFDALKHLFVDNGDETNQRHSHLVYASLWSLNDNNPEDIFLEKEHTSNFLGKSQEQVKSTPYIIDRNEVHDGKKHCFYDYIKSIYDKMKRGEELKFNDIIDPKQFPTVNDQFTNFDVFLESQNLCKSDILVLVPIFPFDKNKLNYFGLLTLYFDEKSYSYYNSFNFLETVSRTIFSSQYIVIQNMQRKLREKLIQETGFIIEKEKEYYRNACEIIRNSIRCKECLIYLYEGTTLKKVFDEEITIPPNICMADLSSRYPNFSIWFDNYRTSLEKDNVETSPFIYSKRDFIYNDTEPIYSSMLIPILDNKKEIVGFIELINKIKSIDGEDKGSSFLYYHFDIASTASDIISLSIQILKQYKISDGTLSKLNHELPAQTEVITQNAKSIIEELKYQKISKRDHINNLVYRISGAASIIRNYSQYAKMKNFDGETANSAREALNLKTFLMSSLDIFRADARKSGVDVRVIFNDDSKYENTIYVHQLFQTAIINLVNNAVKYAVLGTCVIIKMISTGDEYKIIVENMGIAIPDDDSNRIWEENFRGKKATEKCLTGTGLGLSLVQRIVEAHGGTVIAEADNDLFDYNIFGIIGLHKALKEIESNEKRMSLLNCFTKEGKKDYEELSLPIPPDIIEKYNKYSVFRLRDNELIKEFIAYRKENNILFEEMATLYLKEPISHIKFTVSIKK
ncbi:MAG: sensor histidine kinase [Bacteroidales bacterium]|nr:sensor histidine kinase [Bacteroidales bacterium]